MKQRLLVGAAAIVLSMFVLTARPFGPTEATTRDVESDLKTFSQVLSLVEDNYVDEVSSEDLVYAAIRGMLGRLDPHCSFLDPRSYRAMQEEQQGSFSGLGIVISLRGGGKDLTVISPIDGTPAQRAGIRAGDVISHIEEVPTEGITIDEALEKLRGPKGSRVNISIHREGIAELLDFSLIRDDIPTVSIPYAFMLEDDIGYIRIKNFTQTTDHELEEKIAQLEAMGMQRLLLDLRWNPGGLLDQAVKVSDRFLEPRDLIVYTKGRVRNSYQEFRSGRAPTAESIPLIVLVNKGSASASEIVAGAIQDHDRGLIVGETTWGKGLVQTVYRLSQQAGVALTTAKYYTPSGRLIQRDYKDNLDDYYSGRLEAEEADRETRFTDAGRKVLGGGGISPDLVIELEEATRFEQSMERRSLFFEYAVKHIAEHPKTKDDFAPDQKVLEDYRKYVSEKELPFTDEDWEESADYIATMIQAEVKGALFGLEERQKVIVEHDNQVQGAIDLFPAAARMPLYAFELDGLKPASQGDQAGPDQKAGAEKPIEN
jgi:carboxyl-terminal processing protease